MDDAWADLPMLLTVDEAARLLRAGRSHAYNQTTLYFETSGIEGIPAIRIGGVIRVPKHALHELITTGRLVQLLERRSRRCLTDSSESSWFVQVHTVLQCVAVVLCTCCAPGLVT
jgi:hypothetical protein